MQYSKKIILKITAKSKLQDTHTSKSEIDRKVYDLPEIQTKIEKSGNIRKRTIFDGFHLMMRNLFLVILFADLFALIIGCPSPFTACMVSFSKNGLQISKWICVLTILFAQLLMLSRYYHFAYLKYKYIFEDYNLLFSTGMNCKPTAELNSNTDKVQ